MVQIFFLVFKLHFLSESVTVKIYVKKIEALSMVQILSKDGSQTSLMVK